MKRLRPDECYKVVDLVNEITFNNLFARVVVENKVDGEVFVDDELSPTVCLVIHKYGMGFLCGNHQNDSFNCRLVDFLKNDTHNNGRLKWMLAYPEEWENRLAGLLSDRLIKVTDDMDIVALMSSKQGCVLQAERINFKFNAKFFTNGREIPEGFAVKKIDAEIYGKISGSVIPQYFWDTPEDFLENGIGFAMVYGDQVVSTCFASFIVDNKLELGIETASEFRRKGYSVYAASALIEYCLANGYEPVWACRKGNLGSFNTAQKLGFAPVSYHPYYGLCVG